MSNMFLKALRMQSEKVFTAFITWGLGMVLMIVYSYFVLWLKNNFNEYVMIVGALVFLTMAFFFIDLWWSYHQIKQPKHVKGL